MDKTGPNPQNSLLIGDRIVAALDTDLPRKTLMNMIVGANGINPQSPAALQKHFESTNPEGKYSLGNVKMLKSQSGRALYFLEAQSVANILREAHPEVTELEIELCIEILTGHPAPEELIDRYLAQKNSAGVPQEISLKQTLEEIAAREGKSLAVKSAHRFIPDMGLSAMTILHQEERLGTQAALTFAERLKLEGNRKKDFLTKTQRIIPVNPLDIVDKILIGEMAANKGAIALLEQTGKSQAEFSRNHNMPQKAMRHWCTHGDTDEKYAQFLADDLCHPELGELFAKIFDFRNKSNSSMLDATREEHTNYHIGRIVDQLRQPRSNPIER